MVSSQQAEKGNRLHQVKVRARQHEKVAEHCVRVPVGRQIRQAIENKISAMPRLFNGVVYAVYERLETVLRTHFEAFAWEIVGQQWRVAREPQVP